MALMNAYLVTTKNLESFLNSLLSAKAPERFTIKFLNELEFKTTNDQLFIRLLKGLGFLDESGVPTQRYFDYLDQSRSPKVLASAIREAYEDLFRVNVKAQELSSTEVKNKLKTLTQGQKSDNVLTWMSNTFTALCSQADWTEQPEKKEKEAQKPLEITPADGRKHVIESQPNAFKETHLHYNIQIHLPESRDAAVYDAIFRSLKEHLLL